MVDQGVRGSGGNGVNKMRTPRVYFENTVRIRGTGNTAIETVDIRPFSTFVIVPTVSGPDTRITITVTYQDPQVGEPEASVYLPFTTVTAEASAVPNSKRVFINTAETGIKGVRISANGTTGSHDSTVTVYQTGYNLQ